jgi:hypothetical protein
MTTWHDRCYLAVRDKGLVILDITELVIREGRRGQLGRSAEPSDVRSVVPNPPTTATIHASVAGPDA